MAQRIRPASTNSLPSIWRLLFVPTIIAAILGIGLLIFSTVNGGLSLPFGGGDVAAASKTPKPLRSDEVWVYASPRPLPAFTKLTIDRLLSKDGQPLMVRVDRSVAEERGLFEKDVDLASLQGRILGRDKPGLYAFTKKDLLPRDTKPGPNAGIPPGMRGVWVDVSKVTGLADMGAGDCVDLVAATADAPRSAPDTSVLGNVTDTIMRARLTAAATNAQRGTSSSAWVVARKAQVIAPTRSRPKPGSAGKRGAATTLDEIFLAMEPDDVTQFSKALAQGVTLLAAPRSSQPDYESVEIADDRPADATAELQKLLGGNSDQPGSMQMIEVIRGGRRETVTVPRGATGKDQR